MKLDYFSLLSPEPIVFERLGGIISPTLRDVSKIGYRTYQNYISVLLTDIRTYYDSINELGDEYFKGYTVEQKDKVLKIKSEYDSLSDDDRNNITFFDVVIFDEIYRNYILNALNFFIVDKVIFSDKHNVFFTFDSDIGDDSKPTGFINRDIYNDVVDIILQRICMQRQVAEENVKVKNKTAARLLEKIKQANKKQKKKQDKKMELPNLVSALASHSKNLNIVNIWDLTVYQLYDQFRRQQLEDYYDINSSRVAAWGDSEGKFDNTAWLSLINED